MKPAWLFGSHRPAPVSLFRVFILTLSAPLLSSCALSGTSSSAVPVEGNRVATLRRERGAFVALIEEVPAPRLRQSTSTSLAAASMPAGGASITADGMEFGKYYALIKGIRSYTKMDSLDTPKDDARTMAGLLSGAPGYLMLKGGPQLFLAMAQQVKVRSAASGFAQSVEHKVIKGAGHEVGDFFVPI